MLQAKCQQMYRNLQKIGMGYVARFACILGVVAVMFSINQGPRLLQHCDYKHLCLARVASMLETQRLKSAVVSEMDKTRLLSPNKRKSYDFYEPEWSCPNDIRVGIDPVHNIGDGPKFVCEPKYLLSKTVA